MYEGVPPWDIGRPQPAFERLAETGAIGREVLDVGCGTGENALMLAGRGHLVLGLDASPRAIAKANAKAEQRAVPAQFVVGNALELDRLGRVFDSVIDCGLFHVFDDPDRPRFARSLQSALRAGGSYFMLAFSEKEPGGWGPRRVTKKEIKATFAKGWKVKSIEESAFDANLQTGGEKAHAWLTALERE
jgi:2-polyprenyl-3-methyl-5-hydroxy-6-metoxy-1,4-benzoquinol methylase